MSPASAWHETTAVPAVRARWAPPRQGHLREMLPARPSPVGADHPGWVHSSHGSRQSRNTRRQNPSGGTEPDGERAQSRDQGPSPRAQPPRGSDRSPEPYRRIPSSRPRDVRCPPVLCGRSPLSLPPRCPYLSGLGWRRLPGASRCWRRPGPGPARSAAPTKTFAGAAAAAAVAARGGGTVAGGGTAGRSLFSPPRSSRWHGGGRRGRGPVPPPGVSTGTGKSSRELRAAAHVTPCGPGSVSSAPFRPGAERRGRPREHRPRAGGMRPSAALSSRLRPRRCGSSRPPRCTPAPSARRCRLSPGVGR